MTPSPQVRISWSVPIVSCHDDSNVGPSQHENAVTNNNNLYSDPSAALEITVPQHDDDLNHTIEVPTSLLMTTLSEISEISYDSYHAGLGTMSNAVHLQGIHRPAIQGEEKWREHGKIFREKLLQKDQLAQSQENILSDDCELCLYFEVVEKVNFHKILKHSWQL
jgi:hypothetical protein